MPDRRPRLLLILSSVVGGMLLVVSLLGVVLAFQAGGLRMSIHGWVALGLAVVFTGGLTAGLISLAFYSSRHGYDERGGTAETSEDDEADPPPKP